jgi:hypothetical protein
VNKSKANLYNFNCNVHLNNFKLLTIRQEITGPPYEEMDGKFYVDRSGSFRTIT